LAKALGVSPAYLDSGDEFSSFSPDVREVVVALESLPPEKRKVIIEVIRTVVDLAIAPNTKTAS
jgi:hypothetical protein